MLLQAARIRLFTHPIHPSPSFHFTLPFIRTTVTNSATKHPKLTLTTETTPKHTQKTVLFIPPGTDPEQVTEDIILPNSNIVLGPYAGDAKVKEVQFIGSSVRPKDCPKDDRPEFAMLGRSNVGKSSLINSLVRKKEVALTSKKPGKTQLINHFLVNRSWYLVDLPGYG
ncbi:P-loop containing nucleoside triphosphate hydrolases superfamily protein [Artemisia annua]|uniref:P-loop containing nucleoside triphosphate hydrolases superfamily protein n=1 Tax=Artemisia annua TaxID=35608 RepID=A0A2U1N8Z7_ARTAN|nr:P-loop containing nucleoside triphosphate hydrolases superfamily protein [Artemisia annua]